jgi:hypothetical protein
MHRFFLSPGLIAPSGTLTAADRIAARPGKDWAGVGVVNRIPTKAKWAPSQNILLKSAFSFAKEHRLCRHVPSWVSAKTLEQDLIALGVIL